MTESRDQVLELGLGLVPDSWPAREDCATLATSVPESRHEHREVHRTAPADGVKGVSEPRALHPKPVNVRLPTHRRGQRGAALRRIRDARATTQRATLENQ